MRGAVVTAFGGPEHIVIRNDLPLPEITQPDQVLIDVRAGGVNPIDTYIRAGTFYMRPQLPFVPGFDGAGVVREIGPTVSHLSVGDRVWFFGGPTGGAAEVVVAKDVFALPRGLSFVEGACLGIPYATAHRALFTKGHVKAGERVLIHGASGGVGLAACQLARLAGAALVVGTAGTKEGMEAVLKNGAHHAVNHRDAGYVEQLKEMVPEGFDLIIEMVAPTNLNADFDLLARDGRVGIVGGHGSVSIAPRALMLKEASAFGVVHRGVSMECAECFDRLFTTTAYRPVCSKTYSLEGTAQCHRDMIDPSLPTVGNRINGFTVLIIAYALIILRMEYRYKADSESPGALFCLFSTPLLVAASGCAAIACRDKWLFFPLVVSLSYEMTKAAARLAYLCIVATADPSSTPVFDHTLKLVAAFYPAFVKDANDPLASAWFREIFIIVFCVILLVCTRMEIALINRELFELEEANTIVGSAPPQLPPPRYEDFHAHPIVPVICAVQTSSSHTELPPSYGEVMLRRKEGGHSHHHHHLPPQEMRTHIQRAASSHSIHSLSSCSTARLSATAVDFSLPSTARSTSSCSLRRMPSCATPSAFKDGDFEPPTPLAKWN